MNTVVDRLVSARAAVGRSELELVLCCARTHLECKHTTHVRALLRHDIDWHLLLQTADAHGVMPLLYWSLHAVCPDAVPEDVLIRLQHRFLDNAQSNLFRTQELLKVLALLSASGVSAVPLKGPVLTASVYGNLALRQFADLDILVRPQDAARARDIILACGYRLRTAASSAPSSAEFHSSREFPLISENGRVAIDLQWHVPSDWRAVRTFPLDADRLWEHLDSFVLAGTTVSTFAPEDLMLILCVHGASHGWAELRFVCDVAELMRSNPEMNMEWVLAQGDTLGVARMVLLGLLLAHDLLGTTLSAQVTTRIQVDRAVRSLARQVGEWMFGEPGAGYLARRLQEALFSIRLRERARDRIPYVLYFLDFPRRHISAWLLGRSLAT